MKTIELHSSTIALVSDIHLGLNNSSELFHTESINFFSRLKKDLIQKNIKDIIFLGDVFHDRSEISLFTLQTCTQILNSLKEFNIIVILGNHDVPLKYSHNQVSSVSILSGYPNVYVVTDVEYIIHKNKKLGFLSWFTDHSKRIEPVDILFAHLELSNFKFNNYSVCEHGMNASSFLNSSYTSVYTGHFHKHQVHKYTNGKITYVGSPFQHNYGDVGNENGYYLLNIETGEDEFCIDSNSPKFFRVGLNELPSCPIENNHIKIVLNEELSDTKYEKLCVLVKSKKPKSLTFDHLYSKTQTSNVSDNSIDEFNILSSTLEFTKSIPEIQYIDEIEKRLKNYF